VEIPGVAPEHQPRLTAVDFLNASVWETHHADPHAAYCVREATVLTLRLNGRFAIRSQVREFLMKKKETEHANN